MRLLAPLIFIFSSALVTGATSFLTEPLFTFFFLFALYFSVRYIKNAGNKFIYLSFFFAGLAYYVRPNGILVLAALAVIYLAAGWKNLRKLAVPLLIGFMIFWATAAPFLIQRYEAFGSPFTYGENDKFWVDNYAQVWSSNLKAPTAMDYFRSHSPKEIFDRYIVYGAGRLAYDLFRPKDLPFLLFFILIGAGLNVFKKEYWPLYLSLLVFGGGLTLVYYIFYAARYVWPLFPIIIIFMAAGVYEIIKDHRYKEILLAVFLVCYILLSAIAIDKAMEPTLTMPDWAVWAAENLKGKISVMEGGDLIIMNLPDATTAGVGQKDLYAPQSGLAVFKPGYFIDLPQAMAYFKTTGVTHILYDGQHLSMHWYLRELPDHQSWFKEIYSNASSSDPWKVEIYQIEWDKYNKSVK